MKKLPASHIVRDAAREFDRIRSEHDVYRAFIEQNSDELVQARRL